MKGISLSHIASLFRTFSERECRGVSPLYFRLTHDIAENEFLLTLAKDCRTRQPIPNLFLGAIHYLLLKYKEEELRTFYPSISKQKSKKIPIELFIAFCKKKETEIREIIQTRIVQTNSINRTAYLMPLIASALGKEEAINIMDIGTSSGLTMNFDLYEYSYDNGARYGNSAVKIKSTILEGELPKFVKPPLISRKIGIDQNPLDLRMEDNALWLKALIWPDMLERFEQIEAAIKIAKNANLELYKADQIAEFESVIGSIPPQETLLIYHTHVLYQFKPSERHAFRALLDEIGKKRDFWYLAVEADSVFDRIQERKGILIELTQYIGGIKNAKIVGQTDGHATWIKFFD